MESISKVPVPQTFDTCKGMQRSWNGVPRTLTQKYAQAVLIFRRLAACGCGDGGVSGQTSKFAQSQNTPLFSYERPFVKLYLQKNRKILR